MDRISPEFFKKYEALLADDPDSQAFAPLAEAYLRKGQVDRAEALATHGVEKHPKFTGAHLVRGQVFLQRGQFLEAAKSFETATRLSPENIRAHSRLAQAWLKLHEGKKALGSFKMVLLLNPHDIEAQKMVQKLESLSAEDYDADLFQIQALPLESIPTSSSISIEDTDKSENRDAGKELKRKLSLVDAFMARSDFEPAAKLISQLKMHFPQSRSLAKREQLLIRYQETLQEEVAEPIQPRSRNQVVRENQVRTLEKLLQKVDLWRKELESHP